MKDFGYTINKDRQIEYDTNDKRIAAFVRHHEPSFKLCISCGTCTATCSAANFSELNFRKLQLLVKRGMNSEIESEIKKCMLCGKCYLACPRGVNTRNVIIQINKAIEKYKAV
jgi:heterodisulfide reductase subunit C